jgi:hypothetical protein
VVLVVDQRLAQDHAAVEAAAGGGANERLLVGTGEDGAGHGVVDQGELGGLGSPAAVGGGHCEGVVAVDQPGDEADQRAVVLGGERGRDVLVAHPDAHAVGREPVGQAHPDEGVAPADLVRPARQDRHVEPVRSRGGP